MTTTYDLSAPAMSTPATMLPQQTRSRMANLDLLMESREDAYDEMRRLVPGLAWNLADRAELSARQLVATARFDELNRQVRSFRSV